MLGFIGAHRVGKSTLAQAFAQEHDLTFVQTSTSEVFARLGLDPKAEYPIDKRIAIQEVILTALEAQYAAANKKSAMFVADRTPLDLAAYMLADLQRSTLVGNLGVARYVNDYVVRCIEATNRWFSSVVLIQPGIALVEDPTKAPACPAFMEHMNTLCAGLLADDRLNATHFKIRRTCVDLDARLKAVAHVVHAALDAAEVSRQQREASGIVLH